MNRTDSAMIKIVNKSATIKDIITLTYQEQNGLIAFAIIKEYNDLVEELDMLGILRFYDISNWQKIASNKKNSIAAALLQKHVK